MTQEEQAMIADAAHDAGVGANPEMLNQLVKAARIIAVEPIESTTREAGIVIPWDAMKILSEGEFEAGVYLQVIVSESWAEVFAKPLGYDAAPIRSVSHLGVTSEVVK